MKTYINKLKETLDRLDEKNINYLVEVLRWAKRIYVFGNGGSAATASHFVVDLQKVKDKRAFCLNDNVPIITAYANDVAYEDIFARQVSKLVTKNDVVMGISASGNSENVIRGIYEAQEIGAVTVGLTGYGGGELGTIVEIHVNVPIDDMQIVEDIHLAITHILTSKI